PVAPRFDLVSHHERDKELRGVSDFSTDKAFGCDANDGKRPAIERERPADYSGVRIEAILPAVVTDDRNGAGARREILFSHKRSAQYRPHSQGFKVIAGNQITPHSLVATFVAQADGRKTISHQT